MKKNSLVSTFQILEEEGLCVLASSYNKNYFENAEQFLNRYGMLFRDFANSSFKIFLDFLQESVDTNLFKNDFLIEQDFKLKGGAVKFKQEGEKFLYINFGEFEVDYFSVYVSGRYFFIEDYRNNKKYIYYTD